MKVRDFMKQLESIGYNDDTEIVFNMCEDDENKTVKDFYSQSVYTMLGYNAIGIDIDSIYK